MPEPVKTVEERREAIIKGEVRPYPVGVTPPVIPPGTPPSPQVPQPSPATQTFSTSGEALALQKPGDVLGWTPQKGYYNIPKTALETKPVQPPEIVKPQVAETGQPITAAVTARKGIVEVFDKPTGKTKEVYDPYAWSTFIGEHAPGYYGFKGYSTQAVPVGQDPTPDQLRRLADIPDPRTRLSEAKRLGLIPLDARYIKTDGEWGWLTPAQAKQHEAIEALGGIEKFKQTHIELPDGNWISKREWDALPKSIQDIGAKKGIAGIGTQIAKQEVIVNWLTKPTIAPAGMPPPITREEVLSVMKPEDVTESEFKAIEPYISGRGEIDIGGAISEGVDENIIKKSTGISDKDYADAKWFSEYENAPFTKQMYMVAQKDPAGFSQNMAIGMVPLVGTTRFWGDAKPWERGLMVLGDVLFFTVVGIGVSAGVKGGLSLPRAALATTRGVITAPYTALRHPVQTFKAMYTPVQTLLKPKQVPLAVIWRGEYSPMSVSKIPAGAEPMLTRNAMDEVTKLATAGKKASAPILDKAGKEVARVSYSPTGLQNILGDTTIHATPYGASFIGKAVDITDPLFTAPTGYYKLTPSTAVGSTARYVAKGKDIVADLGKMGKAIDGKGKTVGYVKTGEKVLGFDGKTIGKTNIKGFVLDKKNKVIGRLDFGGVAINLEGKTIGWLADKAKVISIVDNKTVIGGLKPLPTFAVIRTAGVSNMPSWVAKAKTMKEMERLGEKAFRESKYAGELLPPLKQYKKWIELENIYPKGTKLIPLLDEKMKPVVLETRGVGNEKIFVPLLQEVDPDWFKASLALTKSMAGKQVGKVKAVDFKNVRQIPSKSAMAVKEWFKGEKSATIYGSYAEYIQTGARIPNDIDAVVANMLKSAKELARIIKRTSGIETKVIRTPKGGAAVKILKDGIWQTSIDLHPLSTIEKVLPYGLAPSKPIVLDGVRMESLSTQFQRLLVKAVEDWGETPMRLQQVAKRLGIKLPISKIDARPPTLRQLYQLKARGFANVVRDIFKKDLTVEGRMKAVKGIAPELAGDVDGLIRQEESIKVLKGFLTPQARKALGKSPLDFAKYFLKQERMATGRTKQMIKDYYKLYLAGIGKMSPKTTKQLRLKRLVEAQRKIDTQRKLEIGVYGRQIKRLNLELRGRVALFTRIMALMPTRYTTRAERRYRQLVFRPTRVPARLKVPSRIQRFAVRRVIPREAGRGIVRIERRQVPLRQPSLRIPSRRPPPRIPSRRPPFRIPLELPPPRELLPISVKREELKKALKEVKGAITWRQGALKRGKELRDVWYVVRYPYRSKKDVDIVMGKPPVGATEVKGVGSAYQTIQTLVGKPPGFLLELDLGIFDIAIRRPPKGGRTPSAITYKRDVRQKTKKDIMLKGIRAG